jgi:hAT family C-terminal dimerisation region
VNSSFLKAESLLASKMIKEDREDLVEKAKPGTSITLYLASIIKLLSQNLSALGNLLKCIQIAMTIPVTSASCERSFSAMTLVKPCLRNRSDDQRLSDLVTLFTCEDRELDREEIRIICERINKACFSPIDQT